MGPDPEIVRRPALRVVGLKSRGASDSIRRYMPSVPTRARVRRCCALSLVTMLACASCTRLETVPLPQLNADGLVGREVRVTMTDGRVLDFEVEVVTQDSLIGDSGRVALDEIAQVERRGASIWKTAGVAAGVVVVAVTVGFVVFLVQWINGMSGS